MNTILLVDDDRYVIEGLLRHIPWDAMQVSIIGTAADGREALEKYQALRPDIVITDIYMPVMDGFELIAAIREYDPNVPIVILSGYDDLENARKAVHTGVHHFLLKPPSLAEIEFVVREVVQLLNEQQEHDDLLAGYLQQQEVVGRSMKEAFFRELLTTRYREGELSGERIAFMQLPPQPSVQVLTISLVRSGGASRRDEREWQLLRFGTGNIIREALSEGMQEAFEVQAELLAYSDQEFVLVLLGDALADERMQTHLERLANEMLGHILQYMKLPSLAGLGTVRSGYHQVLDSYLESRRALQVAEMNEWNRLYVHITEHASSAAETGMGNTALSGRPSARTLAQLHDAMLRRQWSPILSGWQQLSVELLTQGVSLAICRGICAGLASLIWLADETSDVEAVDNKSAQAQLEELLRQLHRAASPRQVLEAFDAALHLAREYAGEGEGGKRSHALIERVITEHVKRCYHQELSLERIAASLHVNRNYLSQLFKRVTGEAFVTYVNKYRIEKAVELLRTGQYMVYEVSERVGFQNATYFSQVFKSIAGCSPSEYHKWQI